MEPGQNTTQTQTQTPRVEEAVQISSTEKLLKQHQREYIDFVAVGGLMTDEDGKIKQKTAASFAEDAGVHRTRLYDWQKTIPHFWELVEQRRKELSSKSRIAKIYNGLYLRAAAGDARAAAIYLANHDPNFRMPNEKVQEEAADSWAALMAKRVKPIPSETPKVVEAEVISNGTSPVIT